MQAVQVEELRRDGHAHSLTHSLTDAQDRWRVVAISKLTGPGKRRRHHWQGLRYPLLSVAATSALDDREDASIMDLDDRRQEC